MSNNDRGQVQGGCCRQACPPPLHRIARRQVTGGVHPPAPGEMLLDSDNVSVQERRQGLQGDGAAATDDVGLVLGCALLAQKGQARRLAR